ncbi:MAG: VanW family protein [Eubacteriales bacterium]|nr:VanW family protein [Eubacteriales bacterium]
MARQNQDAKAGAKKTKNQRVRREKRSLFVSLCLLLIAVVVVYFSWLRNYSALDEQNVLRPARTTKPAKELADSELKSERLPSNLSLSGIQLGDLEIDAAIEALNQHLDDLIAHEFTFYHGEKEVRVSGPELGLKIAEPELRKILAEAVKSQKGGSLEIPLEASAENLAKVLDKLERNFNKQAKDASYAENSTAGGKLELKPAETGLAFNRGAFVAELKERLLKGQLDSRIELNLEPVDAEIQASDLETDFSLLASAYTNIPYYDANRIHNLIVSCEKISGAIIQPGQIYSFMNVMGDFQPGDGWADAGIQSDGVTVSGLGGGICQTSTTLFQAAILAGLDIVEAHNHDLPSDYCELGQDAMVAYGWSDLKIQNNLKAPVKIIAYFSNPSVIFEIYGPAREAGLTTQLYVEHGDKIKPGPDEKRETEDLEPGETKVFRQRSEGYKTSLYRLWLKNGEVIQKDWITSYTYPAFSAIYLVGKKPKGSETEESDNDNSWPLSPSSTGYNYEPTNKWQNGGYDYDYNPGGEQSKNNYYDPGTYPSYQVPDSSQETGC